jgi:hypothetical protein
MARGPKGEKRPGDVVGAAVMVAKIATEEAEDDLPDPAKRKSGQIGGKARSENLTQARRSEIAKEGALSRKG